MWSRMSLHQTSSCNMHGHPCRTSRPRRATCKGWNVALLTDPERHDVRCMSHGIRTWGDMLTYACRTSQPRQATCKDWNVALLTDPERHARAGMSLRTGMWGDMDPYASSPWRSSKATFTRLLVAPRSWVGRHAAATLAAFTRGHVAFGSRAVPRWIRALRCRVGAQRRVGRVSAGSYRSRRS
jgi:hypothetical protein